MTRSTVASTGLRTLPFSETRNYVQRVMENLQVYRARFAGGMHLQIEADLHRGRGELVGLEHQRRARSIKEFSGNLDKDRWVRSAKSLPISSGGPQCYGEDLAWQKARDAFTVLDLLSWLNAESA